MMFGKTVHEEEFGPLSYNIKSPKRGHFTLWLNGCRIGKPKANGEVWEFTAKTLNEAKEEMRASAKCKLLDRILDLQAQLADLQKVLEELDGQ